MPLARTPDGLLHPLIRLPLLAVPFLLLYVGLQLGFRYAVIRTPVGLRPFLVSFGFIIAAGGMIVLYRRAVGWLERRTADELATVRIRQMPWGILVGLGLLTAVQLTAMAVGASRITGIAGFSHLFAEPDGGAVRGSGGGDHLPRRHLPPAG
jgi:hypothetical protein